MRVFTLVQRGLRQFGSRYRTVSFLLLASAMFAGAAQNSTKSEAGLAWGVRGVWRVEGSSEPLRAGDTVRAGALLLPDPSDSDHSIAVLLPDGQRVFSECFTVKDCERGFRVPALEETPSPFAIQLVERIRGVLLEQRADSRLDLAVYSAPGRDEAAAAIGADNRIEIAGLAASLSNGRYIYNLTPIHSADSPETGVALEKSGRSIPVRVPGPGLYRMKIVDSLGNPRIDYLIAAVPRGDRVLGDFEKAHALFKEWREEFQGWPMHDFQRAYLEALMLKIPPAAQSRQTFRRTKASLGAAVTAEPVFSPKPGMSNGNMEISLSCATPGAAIHYTIDGSQPFDSSPVYHAPIVMKRIPIRIKAFAESPGRKDSPVVTGSFRTKAQ